MKSIVLFIVCLALVADAKNDTQEVLSSRGDTPEGLLLNQIQVIGSHNSYKEAMDLPIFQNLKQRDLSTANALDYSHIGLSEQLSMGLSNLEIDIYADGKGGKYAAPQGLELVGQNANIKDYDADGLMNEPGFKVFHLQDIDFRSSCLTFKSCLQELRTWSEANPGHNPIFITINAKDQPIDKPGFTVPEKFTAKEFNQLDKIIQENLGREKLLIPDEVRGNYNTLESAVLQGNWPTLEATKGKFIFILDETGEKITTYIQDSPSLKGRILFANVPPGSPEAAILIMNDPIKDLNKIQDLVKRGYIVRTRADANTKEARNNDKSMFEAACKSGAQIITTDYYIPSTHFKSDYKVSFEDGTFFRENPLFK